MEITTIGIDLAKSVFAVSCADGAGKVVMRRQLRRGQVLEFMGEIGACVVGMEACGGAHHWARAISKLGHEVRLMSPGLVKPYCKGPNKHDRNDADAICEAVRRPQMRYVAVKSVAQQDLLALHRVRAQLMKHRIALSNQLRALLHERGVVARLGAKGLRIALAQAQTDERNEVSGAIGALLLELSGWLRESEERIATITKRIERAVKDDERCLRLLEVPGVGPLIASAVVATVGNAREFKRGRVTERLPGTYSAPALLGRQDRPARDQQAWRSLPAHPVDPWRALAALSQSPRWRSSARTVGGAALRPARAQRGCGRARQSQRAGAVGAAQPRLELSPSHPYPSSFPSRPSTGG